LFLDPSQAIAGDALEQAYKAEEKDKDDTKKLF